MKSLLILTSLLGLMGCTSSQDITCIYAGDLFLNLTLKGNTLMRHSSDNRYKNVGSYAVITNNKDSLKAATSYPLRKTGIHIILIDKTSKKLQSSTRYVDGINESDWYGHCVFD